MNVGNIKIMTGGEGIGTIEEFGSHPWVCGMGVGDNSIRCTSCSM